MTTDTEGGATMTDTTTVPQGATPVAFVAWGPDHPDWDTWWDEAHEVADDNEMCPEFERVVGVMHGKPRPPKHAERERVTVRVTFDIEVEVDYEDNVTSEEIRNVIYGLGRYDLGSAIDDGDYDELERVEVAE